MGYHGDDGRRYSDGYGLPYAEVFSAGDTIGCGVNSNKSTVFYTKNGRFLGKISLIIILKSTESQCFGPSAKLY